MIVSAMNVALRFARLPRYGVFRSARKLGLAASAALFALTWGLSACAEPTIVAILGDSLTQGYGLQVDDGLVPQLQRWLDAQGQSITLMNAGVSGDTTAGGLARVEWTLTPAVQALIVELGGNDALRGPDPAEVRANLDGILKAARAHGLPTLLIGVPAPANFGPSYTTDFNAIFPELAATYGTLLVPNYFAALYATGDRQAVLEQYFQADGIHPNAKGVSLIVKALGPVVQELAAQVNKP